MSSLKAIISYRAGSRQAGVDDGGPAFEPVVMGAMEKIGNSQRESRCTGFNRSERRVIVDDIVCE